MFCMGRNRSRRCWRSTACRLGRGCKKCRRPISPRALSRPSSRLWRSGAGVTTRPDLIAEAFRWACLAELDAPKPGNVHVFADGHRMTAAEFVASADAAAPHLSASGARVGTRILGAVEATSEAVGSNTNLGIILLCAPLAAAAEADISGLRASLVE